MAKIPGCARNIEKAQRGELWVGDAQKSPATGRPVCLITAPIRENGVLVGIAGLPVELADFSNVYVRNIQVGKGGYVAITDGRGMTLAHQNPKLVLKLNISDLDFGKQVLARKEGRLEYVLEGKSNLCHFQTLGQTDWHVLAILPKQEMTDTLASLGYAAGILGVAAIGLVFAAIWLLTGSLISSVRAIAVRLADNAAQTTSAAGQVSDSSQGLAAGCSEQATSIQATSASLEEREVCRKRWLNC